MVKELLPLKTSAQIKLERPNPLDEHTISKAHTIVNAVRTGGSAALREYALGFGDIQPGEPIIFNRQELKSSVDQISLDNRRLIERTATRISSFAEAQRSCMKDLETKVPGARIGHSVTPVEVAGCYAPGGKYPYVSSLLMTVCPAKVAGVKTITVASPNPLPEIKAAAYLAGADSLIPCGGAQAVAALAYGTDESPKSDIVTGPGNRWVNAAKYIVSKDVGIDLIAGPSELVIVADASAEARKVAADLIGQAEHDQDALPVLIALEEALIKQVRLELAQQLETLPNKAVAEESLKRSFCFFASSIEEAAAISDWIAPEHLELALNNAQEVATSFANYGALFIGHDSAEVLCDYGLGPNHILPTSQWARHSGGLSVFTYMRVRTWLQMNNLADAKEAVQDAIAMARLERLEGHARSVEARL